MAASSPAKSNSSTPDLTATPSSSSASKSQRGLNKPKCIKCGNVARSRCPYQSCKSCCAKAQNPCHIHVLKGNSSLPDRPPSSSSPQFDHQSTEVSHSGSVHRLRQLSSNFSQFSNLQTPLRSRRPLTKKDAQVINEWRFLKLKEFKDGNIEAETEAFDRYMQNVGLLEEVFQVKSVDDLQSSVVNSNSDGENNERVVQGLKLKLGSSTVRTDILRKRIRFIADQGLRKLGKTESADDGNSDLSNREARGITTNKRIKSLHGEVAMALTDINDKLNKARNEDDLKACQEMASDMFRWNSNTKTGLAKDDEFEISSQKLPMYDSFKKWFSHSTVDQEVLCRIDAQFSSLEEIEDL
ncbi:hypothetical protein CASFOL_010753 [Castilleja foliolosa]|uniref:Uncharacterized protein n=1 Tax=Castilleja foliolosa TaxID=1961234 RepID=A0ABD3DU02_9LAMI